MAAGSRLLYSDRDAPGEDKPATAKPHKRVGDMTLDEYNATFGTSPNPKATR